MSLRRLGFFDAERPLLFHSKEDEITNKEDLKKAINEEKHQILNDRTLKEKFEKLNRNFNHNNGYRELKGRISNNPQIIKELCNPIEYKAKLLKNYFHKKKNKFERLLEKYDKSKEEFAKIREQAKNESGEWGEVIEEFNRRFFVPFKLEVVNKDDSILGEALPKIGFKFYEKDVSSGKNVLYEKDVREDNLLRVLSQGEKRALYILNVLFEIEIKKKEGQDCLVVIDDIADSFDYKNKYSIIEYLSDISKEENFHLIILTHNFDFYRSVCSRLGMDRKKKLHAKKR